MIRRLLPIVPVLLFASLLPAQAQVPADTTPLIERARIFGNPSKSGGTLKASTAQVPHGAEFAPGLAEALR